MSIQETIKLARAFGLLVQELPRRQFNEIIELNKSEPENSGVCHSHDFTDANMLMEEAFKNTFGRDFLPKSGEPADADVQLWNDAWEVAKAADFFA